MAKKPATRKKGKKSPAKRAAPKKAPPKKAPPKKKPPPKKRPRGGVSAKSEKASLSLPEDTRASARFRAGMQYIADTQRRPVEWWWENHYQDMISLDRFRKWCAADKWIARRETHWEQVTAAVARETVGVHAKKRTTELELFETALGGAMSHIVGGMDQDGNPIPIPPPKSFGEAVQAATKLHDAVEGTRARIEESMPLALGAAGSGETEEVGIEFSPEELLAMGHATIRVRNSLPPAEDTAPEDVGIGED